MTTIPEMKALIGDLIGGAFTLTSGRNSTPRAGDAWVNVGALGSTDHYGESLSVEFDVILCLGPDTIRAQTMYEADVPTQFLAIIGGLDDAHSHTCNPYTMTTESGATVYAAQVSLTTEVTA